MCSTNKPLANLKYGVILIIYSEAGQLQPTGGPHNLLRTHMWAAIVRIYIYISKGRGGGGGGWTPLEHRYLQRVSYAKSTREWQGDRAYSTR